MLRNLLVCTAALLAASACGPASARSLVDLSVVDRDNGQWLADIPYRGQHWIAGAPGHRYGVRLTNTTGERVLVVLSVDGVNAVSGQTADASQGGYVLDPWETAEIDGWRKSLDDVAQFVFTDLPDSYAARTGRPDNVGVIGIAVFREARPLPPPPPIYAPPIANQAGDAMARESAKAAAPAARAESGAMADRVAPQQRLGTGHGQREWSPVGQTTFERASWRPEQVTQLRYDDADTLAALGIVPRPYWPWSRRAPDAFPGFVPDPPNG